jgi:precorrin-2 dehydrogenase/sirohydrochlorin ferrochelatase
LPPAFFPVGLNLAGRKCVVVGPAADRETIDKLAALRAAGADVSRIDASPELRDEDVADAYFVVLTPQDEPLAARLRALADRCRFLFCAIDQPGYGFVAMVSIVTCGRARIAISTGGAAPGVGAQLRAKLQAALDDTFARFLECLIQLRRRVRANSASSEERRAIMRNITDGFDVEVRLTYPEWFLDELRRRGPSVIEP